MRNSFALTSMVALNCLLSILGGGCATESVKAPLSPDDGTVLRIRQLLASIDSDPDPFHTDSTAAGRELIQLGEIALPYVLDLMLAEDAFTRLRAERVLIEVTCNLYGAQSGQGWKSRENEDEWRRLWVTMGNMKYDAPAAARIHSISLWKAWLQARQ